jgi:hypothetical protein
VEFPDQHERPLVRTTLYVDGMVADENTSEPFDAFTWDLSSYAASGEHQVVVEAVDSLGLSRTTISQPIALTVIQPPRGPAALLARYRQPITIAAVALAGLALLAILLTGRLRLPSARAALEARRADRDPVTQPVPATQTVPHSIAQDKPRRRTPGKAKPSTATPAPPAPAPASLLRLMPDGQPASANPIPLAEKELTFGVDPEQCNVVLDDASVAAAHARLKRTQDGGYLLMDNSSVAGTWVNFKPVPHEGELLQHGDMVHFGRLFFRFALQAAPKIPEPKIEPPIPEE